jgi:hypothetical protein
MALGHHRYSRKVRPDRLVMRMVSGLVAVSQAWLTFISASIAILPQKVTHFLLKRLLDNLLRCQPVPAHLPVVRLFSTPLGNCVVCRPPEYTHATCHFGGLYRHHPD